MRLKLIERGDACNIISEVLRRFGEQQLVARFLRAAHVDVPVAVYKRGSGQFEQF
jgi:hypothetical protein